MYQQPSHSVRGLYALLFSAVLLSLASCGGGGGGGGGGAAKSTATDVSAGFFHTCALVGNGTVQCWGSNSQGQLGLDTATASSSTPVPVSGLSGVTAISAGGFHTCVVQGGAAKCWGANTIGQLGVDTATASSSTPVQVTDLGSGVTAISAGESHTCAIHNTADEGEPEAFAAKCWGNGGSGQLGIDTTTSSTPVQVTGLTAGVTAIAAGVLRSCAVVAGVAKCWGDNGNGELGVGDHDTTRNEPVDVIGLVGSVMDIAAGGSHTCALMEDGTAKCWGSGSSGKLGIGSTRGATPAEGAVMNLDSGVTAIAAGHQHTCAIHNGAAKCWGSNTDGSLGDGSDDSQRKVPVDVMDLSSGVTAIAAGTGHTCAVHNGAVKCWGNNRFGKLGDNTETVYETNPETLVDTLQGPDNNRNTPTTVTGF